MARNVWRDMKRLTDRVDQAEVDIEELKGAVVMERDILRDQRQRVTLLTRLCENHSRGITRLEQAVGRIKRSATGRRRK